MLKMVMDYVGDRRVPLAVVFAAVTLLYGFHEWADLHYYPMESAQASEKELRQQIAGNGKLISDHISKYEINENKKAIGVVHDQQFQLKQFEAVNGANDMTVRRTEELRRKLIDLNDTKACLHNGNENCE